MENGTPQDRVLRRIVLPSGKTIEVLQLIEQTAAGDDPDRTLESAPGPADSAAGAGDEIAHSDTPSTSDPHLCRACDTSLVYPVAWNGGGPERWSVDLRCPNCERTETALLDLDVAESFDDELDRGSEVLVNDLARLVEANMRETLERLIAALRADAIVPEDF
jgi:hypothetical protein